MMTEPAEKSFDAVGFMRKTRDRISDDIADMDYETLKRWLESASKGFDLPHHEARDSAKISEAR